jgi:hypothetical protein
MPRAGFELAIPMFERPKTAHALDRAGIETGHILKQSWKKGDKNLIVSDHSE